VFVTDIISDLLEIAILCSFD